MVSASSVESIEPPPSTTKTNCSTQQSRSNLPMRIEEMYGIDVFSGPIKIKRNRKAKVPTAPNRLAQSAKLYAAPPSRTNVKIVHRFKTAKDGVVKRTVANSYREYKV